MTMKALARYYPYYAAPRQSRDLTAPQSETGYYYAEQAQETHLRDYWKIFLKRIRYVVLILCASLAGGALLSLLSPTLYTARSTIKIEPQNPMFTGVAEVLPAQLESGPYDYYQTQFAMLGSAPLAARVIKSLGLESDPVLTARSFQWLAWLTSTVNSLKDSLANLWSSTRTEEPGTPSAYALGVAPALVNRYLKFLSIDPVRNTRLVDITFNTPNPALSQRLANEHATSFIQMILENRFNLTQEAREFLGRKLTELREKVQRAENQLHDFRRQHGVVSLEKGENIVVDRLVDLNKQLTQARSERIQTESLYQMTRNKNHEYLAQVLGNPMILQLKTSLANMEGERVRLSSIYTQEHPRIHELDRQIAAAKKTMANEIGTIVRGIESNYAASRAREQALEAEAKRQQQMALDLKQVGVDYAVLNEEVAVHRGLYENVLKRMNETNVANDLAASNIQVVQRAELPSVPGSPNTLFNLIVSGLLGLFLSLACVFFLEYMDATVSTPQQVWAAVSLATLGVVPHIKSIPRRYRSTNANLAPATQRESSRQDDSRIRKEVMLARDPLSMISESYRTIRTALLLSQADRPPKVILLTSPSPNEGKTVTTLNLAMAFAQGGKRALVIDADLRKGRCHQLVNLRTRQGLANVLTGGLELNNAIKETEVQNFYMLPRGVLAPNPGDLLMSQKMRDVLGELRNSFDFVVIDSPPIIAVSDAALLSALCDGVVLVLNGQKTTAASARRAMERLDKVGARTLGVILNGIDIRDPEYIDYRSYYPSYCATMREETQED